MFDERLITQIHVKKALENYCTGNHKHRPARSAFLIYDGQRLPAKHILRLAFFEATGEMAKCEEFTGGRASVRVLTNLGFHAVYEKQDSNIGRRNPIKSARREAFKQIVSKQWGKIETEKRFSQITVPDFHNIHKMDPTLRRTLDKIQSYRGLKINGQVNRQLAFDFYMPKINLVIEFDERQHFTPLRAASLIAYPDNIKLGFDRKRWICLSESIRAGDNSPIYRDEQRAFYDSIRDILAPEVGLKPVVRIFEEDVAWEKEGEKYSCSALEIIRKIENIING